MSVIQKKIVDLLLRADKLAIRDKEVKEVFRQIDDLNDGVSNEVHIKMLILRGLALLNNRDD